MPGFRLTPRAVADLDAIAGYRSYLEGSHIIFYVVDEEYVDIIGIPHQSMDIGPETL